MVEEGIEELQRLYRRLSEVDRHALLSFGHFLDGRTETVEESKEKLTPVVIDRPPQEGVHQAIRRLTQAYPMLKHERLLSAAADLLAQHLVSGRDAAAVIDEVEALFLEHYQRYLEE